MTIVLENLCLNGQAHILDSLTSKENESVEKKHERLALFLAGVDKADIDILDMVMLGLSSSTTTMRNSFKTVGSIVYFRRTFVKTWWT